MSALRADITMDKVEYKKMFEILNPGGV